MLWSFLINIYKISKIKFKTIFSAFVVATVLSIPLPNVIAQSTKSKFESNIELLRDDLLSMLDIIQGIPPVSQTYIAVKERLEEFKSQYARGEYGQCAIASERVLSITKPYRKRKYS